jgi:ABC-type multidrug transport system ATPase subunit
MTEGSIALRRSLRLENIHVSAGRTRILQGIDMTLEPGQVCALIGPSGAGKSTLIKVLLGLCRADEGRVRLGGQEIGSLGPIGYVPQHDALHTTLTARRALDFCAQLRMPAFDEKARAARVEELAKQVGLFDRLDVRIKRLSGGQKKRVSVALELLTSPPVLILDEPTSGLDPGMEATLMGLFGDVAASGRIVLVSTHAMQSLGNVAQLVVLCGGFLVFAGAPSEALAYFRVEDFNDVFQQLPKMQPAAWGRRFRSLH